MAVLRGFVSDDLNAVKRRSFFDRMDRIQQDWNWANPANSCESCRKLPVGYPHKCHAPVCVIVR